MLQNVDGLIQIVVDSILKSQALLLPRFFHQIDLVLGIRSPTRPLGFFSEPQSKFSITFCDKTTLRFPKTLARFTYEFSQCFLDRMRRTCPNYSISVRNCTLGENLERTFSKFSVYKYFPTFCQENLTQTPFNSTSDRQYARNYFKLGQTGVKPSSSLM